jgi:hypothetical protein
LPILRLAGKASIRCRPVNSALGRTESIRRMQFNHPMLLALLVAGTAHAAEPRAAQRCAAQLQAEQARIEREFARDRPAASDKAANDRWAKNLQVALHAAGRTAESCERQSQPAMTQDRRAVLEACISQVDKKLQEVDRRYAGRTLSREEQGGLREEHRALQDQRIACDLASRK